MSKKNRNNQNTGKRNNRVDWITHGIPELREDTEICLVPVKEDTVAIVRSEYDALIENRYALRLIKKMANGLPSYQFEDVFKALFDETKEDEHEPKSE